MSFFLPASLLLPFFFPSSSFFLSSSFLLPSSFFLSSSFLFLALVQQVKVLYQHANPDMTTPETLNPDLYATNGRTVGSQWTSEGNQATCPLLCTNTNTDFFSSPKRSPDIRGKCQSECGRWQWRWWHADSDGGGGRRPHWGRWRHAQVKV